MATHRLIVFVYLPGLTHAVPAGIFDHDGQFQAGQFHYGERYLTRPDALAVDPVNCPLDVLRIPPTDLNGGLYGAFRDASPDYWGRLVMARRLKIDMQQLSETDLLLHGGASRVGCLDFRLDRDSPEDTRPLPAFSDLDVLVQAADDLKQGQEIDPVLQEILQQGTSLGGARPKCTVVDADGIWLAKFPEQTDNFNNPRIEYAALTLAAQCGLTVARSKIVTLADGRDVLLVHRFDRIAVGNAYSRIGFVSALTLLHSDERDHSAWSYPALAEQMRRYPIGKDDLRELYRRMIFNVVARNTDDHARNHGFLYDVSRMHLSPAYDLVPQPARPGINEDFHLAMTIGVHGRQASLENVLSRCATFGLNREEAVELCSTIGNHAVGWRKHFRHMGVSEDDCRRFEGSFRWAGVFAGACR